MNDDQSVGTDDEQRIHGQQLEEQLAFQERDIEHCRDQIVELWRALDAARQRIDRLEQLLGGKSDESEEMGGGEFDPGEFV